MQPSHSLFFLPAICLGQSQPQVPQISFDKAHHDFGRLLQGQKVSQRYEVTNTGSAPLVLKEIRPSCGCTSAMVGKWTLMPGENAFIEVQYDSTGALGNIQKTIDVISNDPTNPEMELTFAAGVYREILPDRSVVFFDEVPRSGSASTSIHLESGDGRPIVIKSIEPLPTYLTCEAQWKDNDVFLDINIIGRLIPKHTSKGQDVMKIHTNSAHDPILQFNVFWEAVSAITAFPKQVVWNELAGSELCAAITLVHSGSKPFKILGAKSTLPHIKVAYQKNSVAARHTISATISAKAKAGTYMEKIMLKLDDPEQRELEIDVIVVLR
jgi:hypothetical protein